MNMYYLKCHTAKWWSGVTGSRSQGHQHFCHMKVPWHSDPWMVLPVQEYGVSQMQHVHYKRVHITEFFVFWKFNTLIRKQPQQYLYYWKALHVKSHFGCISSQLVPDIWLTCFQNFRVILNVRSGKYFVFLIKNCQTFYLRALSCIQIVCVVVVQWSHKRPPSFLALMKNPMHLWKPLFSKKKLKKPNICCLYHCFSS